METLQAIEASGVVYRLGWTLVHVVWMATVAALVLGVGLRALRRRSSKARYVMACGALGLVLAASVGTFLVIASPERPAPAPVAPVVMAPIPTPVMPPMGEAPVMPPMLPPAPIPAAPVVAAPVAPAASVPLAEQVSHALEPALPWIVMAWCVGVAGLSLWQLTGWMLVQRLQRLAKAVRDPALVSAFARLAVVLRVSRPVRLLESALVAVPTVVGWLRPVVLVPMGFATGLSPAQVEAVLAHELAHIKRHDYLVNLLQVLVETLFFYHPAVWYISRRIRGERENCCDDMALAAGAERFSYAESLVLLARQSGRAGRSRRAAAALLGATGRPSQLKHRIGRLVGTADAEGSGRFAWPTALVILATFITAVALVAGGLGGAASSPIQGEDVFKYTLLDLDAAVVDRLVSEPLRTEIKDSPYRLAIMTPAQADLLVAGVDAAPGVLGTKSCTVSGEWWKPGLAESYSYTGVSSAPFVGYGTANMFLGARGKDENLQIRIDGGAGHSMMVAKLPGTVSLNGKIFFEGRCPESRRLAFLAPYQRGDGKARYHVVLFQIMTVAEAAADEKLVGGLTAENFPARVADAFSDALAGLKNPWLDDAKRKDLRDSLERFVKQREGQGMTDDLRRQIVAAVGEYVRTRFAPYRPGNTFENEAAYLSFPDRVKNFQWSLWQAMQRQPLGDEAAAQRQVQREWLRTYIAGLPEKLPAYTHKVTLADLESQFADPFSPLFHRPMTEDQFAAFQNRLQAGATKDQWIAFVVPHAVWEAIRTWYPDSTTLPLPFDDKVASLGQGNGLIQMSFNSNERFAGRDWTLKAGQYMDVCSPAIMTEADRSRLPAARSGDVKLEVAADGTRSLVAVRGASILHLSGTDWMDVDGMSDGALLTPSALKEASAFPLETLKGLSEINLQQYPGRFIAVRTAEGGLSVLEVRSLDEKNAVTLLVRPRGQAPANALNADKLKATLPSGAEIELTAVSYYPDKGERWWLPDGTALKAPPVDPSEMDISSIIDPTKRKVELVFRLGGKADQPGYESQLIRADGGGTLWTGRRSLNRVFALDLKVIATSVPVEAKTFDMDMKVAAAEWTTVATSDGQKAEGLLGAAGPGGARSSNPSTLIEGQFDPDQSEARMIGVDAKGAKVIVRGFDTIKSGSKKGANFLFDKFEPGQIKSYTLQTRPYERIRLTDIAAQPDQQSEAGLTAGPVEGTPSAGESLATRAEKALKFSQAPHETDKAKLSDLFETQPPGSGSFELRANIIVARSPKESLFGAFYYMPDKDAFYVQHDPAGSGTQTFYGPFKGKPWVVFDASELERTYNGVSVIRNPLGGKALACAEQIRSRVPAIMKEPRFSGIPLDQVSVTADEKAGTVTLRGPDMAVGVLYHIFNVPPEPPPILPPGATSPAEIEIVATLEKLGAKIMKRDAYGYVVELYWGGQEKGATDAGLVHVGGLGHLKKLDLECAVFSEKGLANLAAMTSLEDLGLYSTPVNDAGLAHLAGLTGLKRLSLSETEITDDGLRHLAAMTALESLDLSGNRLTDAAATHLAGLKSLRVLDLRQDSREKSDMRIGDAGLARLKSLQNLRDLDITGTYVTDAGLKELAAFTHLEMLALGGPRITNAGLVHLKGLTTLKQLSLWFADITDEGLASIEGLTALERLNLGSQKVTGAGLAHLRPLKQLNSLDLHGPNFRGPGLAHLSGLTALKHLDIMPLGWGASPVTDRVDFQPQAFAALASLPLLEELSLSSMNIPEAGAAELAKLRQLKFLALNRCTISNQDVRKLKRALPAARVSNDAGGFVVSGAGDWSAASDGLRARIVAPEEPLTAGDEDEFAVEVENTSDKPLLWRFQETLSGVSGAGSWRGSQRDRVALGQGARLATADEVAHEFPGIQDPKLTGAMPFPGIYRLEAGGRLSLMVSTKIEKPGRYPVKASVFRVQAGGKLLTDKDFMVCPPTELTVEAAAGANTPAPAPAGNASAVKDFGVSRQGPIETGYFIYEGKYIDAPYYVERRGLDTYVNDNLVRRGPAWPQTLPDSEMKVASGDAPPGAGPDDPFWISKWRWLSSRNDFPKAVDLMVEAYQRSRGFSLVNVNRKDGSSADILLVPTNKEQPSTVKTFVSTSPLPGAEHDQQYYVSALRPDAVLMIQTGGASEILMGGDAGRKVLGIVASAKTVAEKQKDLDAGGLVKGPEMAQSLAAIVASDQLAQRLAKGSQRPAPEPVRPAPPEPGAKRVASPAPLRSQEKRSPLALPAGATALQKEVNGLLVQLAMARFDNPAVEARLFSLGEPAAHELFRLVVQPTEDYDLRNQIRKVLARFPGDRARQIIEAGLSAVSEPPDPDINVRRDQLDLFGAAMSTLRDRRDRASVPALVKALGVVNFDEQRGYIVMVLGEIGDPAAAPAVRPYLDASDTSLRSQATQALIAMNAIEITPELRRQYGPRVRPPAPVPSPLDAGFKAEEMAGLTVSIGAPYKFTFAVPAARLPEFYAAIESSPSFIQPPGLSLGESWGWPSTDPDLVVVLKDGREVRFMMALDGKPPFCATERHILFDSPKLAALVNETILGGLAVDLKSADFMTRFRAAAALFDRGDPAGRNVLVEALAADKPLTARANAARRLLKEQDPQALKTALDIAAAELDQTDGQLLIQAVAEGMPAQAIPFLRKVWVDGKFNRHDIAAIQALVKVGSPEAVDTLIDIWGSGSEFEQGLMHACGHYFKPSEKSQAVAWWQKNRDRPRMERLAEAVLADTNGYGGYCLQTMKEIDADGAVREFMRRLQAASGNETERIAKSLQGLTGAFLGSDKGLWLEWWKTAQNAGPLAADANRPVAKGVWVSLALLSPIQSIKDYWQVVATDPPPAPQQPMALPECQLEIRRAADQKQVAQVPLTGAFRDSGKPKAEDVSRIGDLPDGEYAVALVANGRRCSNVSRLVINAKFDPAAQPALELVPTPPVPGGGLPHLAIVGTGRTPIDKGFMTSNVLFADLIIDGVARQASGPGGMGANGPLGSGTRGLCWLDLRRYYDQAPRLDPAAAHKVAAKAGKYESALVTVPADGALDAAWDKSPEKGVWVSLAPLSTIRSMTEYWHLVATDPAPAAPLYKPVAIPECQFEIRKAADQKRVAQVPLAGSFRDTGRPTPEDVRRIGNLPDDEYVVALVADGKRISNVGRIVVDAKFDSTKQPPLQLLPVPLTPSGRMNMAVIATGPTPADPEFTNASILWPVLVVDGTERKFTGPMTMAMPVGPLKSGQRDQRWLQLEGYEPKIDPTAKHIVLVKVGKYQSAASLGPVARVVMPAEDTLGAAWDKATAGLTPAPAPHVSIRGTVTGPDGRPAAGYVVSLVGDIDYLLCDTHCDAKGAYEFLNVPATTYTLRTNPPGTDQPGLSLKQVQIPSADKPTLERDLSLEGKFSFSGRVTSPDGKPVAGRDVMANGESHDGTMEWQDSAMTDAHGRYAIRGPFPVAAYVGVSATGPHPDPYHDVKAGRTDLDFVMPVTPPAVETRVIRNPLGGNARAQADEIRSRVPALMKLAGVQDLPLDQVTVTADEKENTLVLTGPARAVQVLYDLWNVPSDVPVRIFPLAADPQAVVEAVKKEFGGRVRGIASDPKSRSVVVAAKTEDLDAVAKFVTDCQVMAMSGAGSLTLNTTAGTSRLKAESLAIDLKPGTALPGVTSSGGVRMVIDSPGGGPVRVGDGSDVIEANTITIHSSPAPAGMPAATPTAKP
jgi:beta-lactamase regulating signal transducer with metallopeptidase domain/HEAT repeat protein/Leucine-rich repeat (LRR) protein